MKQLDAGDDANRSRRMVGEAKKFGTDAAWQVINYAMQNMGGIGYNNVYLIEPLLRDTSLIMMWTGTNEVMDLTISHEYYREARVSRTDVRDPEADALEAQRAEEKVQ